jgi:D-alanyl-D-alanine carboxypeptidase/D-alanyl-D-alanine-endopeptidase (penicillin-binding protein 4)
MKKILLVIGCCLLVAGLSGQTVSQKLQKAFKQFESDSQLKHAISSLYVIDAATGKVVFDKNSKVGLAGASTQKIITAATAFELLGKDFRYKTKILKAVTDTSPQLVEITVIGSGDPTLGSWRYNSTSPEFFFNSIVDSMKQKNISFKNAFVSSNNNSIETVNIPSGWIWEDIGNYYGAGSSNLNWRENQVDIWMKPGRKEGDSVRLLNDEYVLGRKCIMEVKTGTKNSGDNAYVYYDLNGNLNGGICTIKGTIPCCVDSFKISASVPEPIEEELKDFSSYLKKQNYIVSSFLLIDPNRDLSKMHVTPIYTHYSPSLDSIIYWFLKKSINLYGEALIKTFAYEKQGFGSTDSGIAIVKKFWKDKGLDEDELNIYDGSGLSPLNRITTHAQVEVLKYAKTKDWFPYFYDALPEYNGMKMKSGTISDVKGFCGYQKSKDGKEYIFSFLVNNYSGKSSAVVNKMYQVLDELKAP